MRRFWMLALALCVLATAAQAGTIHYKFTAEVTTDNNATATDTLVGETIYGWFKFDTGDVEKTTDTADMAIYEGKSSAPSPWLAWEVTVDGTDYAPTGTPLEETITVGNPSTGADSLVITAIYGTGDPLFFLNLQDGTNALSDTTIPSAAKLEHSPSDTWIWTTREVTYNIGDLSVVADLQTVTSVPLPAAAWAGLGLLGALGLLRRLRRRK